MTVFALGPAGTFSDELATRLFGHASLLPSIAAIFSRVENSVDIGVVPLENSEAGSVGQTLDGLWTRSVFIVGEVYVPIHHQLASRVPLDELRIIFVHPQTSEQCSEVLEQLGVEIIHTSSNAASAVKAKEMPGSGAVVSEHLAAMHGIPIIRRNIENSPDNTTRFVVIRGVPGDETRAEKASIIVDPESDRPGLLYRLLSVFADRGINLTRIESRPSKRGIGSYVFFIDLETATGWRQALADLDAITTVKRLGSYRRLEEM